MNDASTTAELILWRHAEAEDAYPGRTTDAARALTARGHAQAARMAAWINARLNPNALVLVSPAIRTMQTAAALERPLVPDERVGLSATPQSLLAAAEWPSSGAVLVVGHQPTLGQVAAMLLQQEEVEWSLARGAIAWVVAKPGSRPVLKIRMKPDQINILN